MKRIDVEEVKRMCAERQAINKLSVHDIEIFENGKKVKVSKETKDEFDFTGLSTFNFISSNYYKKDKLFEEIIE